MIRLGMRLSLASVRSAPVRWALAMVGCTVAVLMLYGALAIQPALDRQQDRVRLRTFPEPGEATSSSALLWAPALNSESVGSHGALATVAVAAEGPDAPRPLGAKVAPGDGEVLVSPALARLLSRGEGELHRDRIPGRVVGVLTREVLAEPEELVMLVGWDAPTLRRMAPSTMVELHGVPVAAMPDAGGKSDLRARILNVVLGLALLVPVLVFVRIAGRVADTRRRSRLAALDLVGATTWQLRSLAATETFVLAVASLVASGMVAMGIRAGISDLSIAGAAFFVDDLRPPVWQTAAIALLLPLLSFAPVRGPGLSSMSAMRRAANRVRFRWLRLLPIGAGFATLVGFGDASEVAIAVGLALLLAGCLLATPLALEAVTATIRRIGNDRPALLLAGGGLGAYALSRARATAGIAAAVLTGTLAATYFPSHDAWARPVQGSRTTSSAAVQVDAIVTVNGRAADAELLRSIGELVGVEETIPVVPVVDGAARPFATAALTQCRHARPVLGVGPCRSGIVAGEGSVGDSVDIELAGGGRLAGTVEAVEPQLRRLFPPVDFVAPARTVAGLVAPDRVLVDTDGTAVAAERIRGWLARHRGPDFHTVAPATDGSDQPSRNRQDYARVQIVTLFLAVVAASSAALAYATTLLERRRDLSLLLATGVPRATLRRAALLESVSPMIALAALAGAAGFAVAWAVLATVDIPLRASWADVGFVALSMLGPAVLAAVLVLPLVPRSVDPTSLRTE